VRDASDDRQPQPGPGHAPGGGRSVEALEDAREISALIVFSGQFCMTGSRLLVHESVADRVRTGLGARLRAVKVGPAADPASEMGPIIDKPNVERIDKIVEDAIAQGATVIVRGGPVTDGPLAAGAFYRPACLRSATPRCRSSRTRCSARS